MVLRYATKEGRPVLREAFALAVVQKRETFFKNFIQSPLVLIGLLVVSWALSFLVAVMDPFYLPPPILTCIVLFLVLCLLSWLSPIVYDEEGEPLPYKRYVAPVMAVIEKPCSLILQHMAVCFTPSFILIPAGRKLPNRDVGLLIAWFLVSFIAAFVISILIHRLGGLLPFFAEKTPVEDVEAQAAADAAVAGKVSPPDVSPFPSMLSSSADLSTRDWPRKGSNATMVSSISDMETLKTLDKTNEDGGAGPSEKDGGQDEDRDVAVTVKEVDIAEDLAVPDRRSRDWDAMTIVDDQGPSSSSRRPSISFDLALSRVPTPFPESDTTVAPLSDIATRDRLVANLSSSIDIALYAVVALISLPIFYALRVTVPLFLALNILVYLVVIKSIPKPWQRFAHPILVTSFVSFFLIWAFGATLGLSLQETLHQYSTGAGYQEMWSIETPPTGRAPGAGDLLVDGLDAGVIALSLPLYRYRADLRRYFWRMTFLVIPSAVLALFVWPLGALAFGLEPAVALAFVGRFSSTPLAVAQVQRLQGDGSLTVVVVVVTGNGTVILRPYIFKCLFIKDDDFLALGLLFGTTSGAIGATGLLNNGQPRAAAIASLTFALYGTVLLVAIGIPPVATFVQRLVGLTP